MHAPLWLQMTHIALRYYVADSESKYMLPLHLCHNDTKT